MQPIYPARNNSATSTIYDQIAHLLLPLFHTRKGNRWPHNPIITNKGNCFSSREKKNCAEPSLHHIRAAIPLPYPYAMPIITSARACQIAVDESFHKSGHFGETHAYTHRTRVHFKHMMPRIPHVPVPRPPFPPPPNQFISRLKHPAIVCRPVTYHELNFMFVL